MKIKNLFWLLAAVLLVGTGCAKQDDFEILSVSKVLSGRTGDGATVIFDVTVRNSSSAVVLRSGEFDFYTAGGDRLCHGVIDGKIRIARGVSTVSLPLEISFPGGSLGLLRALPYLSESGLKELYVDAHLKARQGLAPLKWSLRRTSVPELMDQIRQL